MPSGHKQVTPSSQRSVHQGGSRGRRLSSILLGGLIPIALCSAAAAAAQEPPSASPRKDAVQDGGEQHVASGKVEPTALAKPASVPFGPSVYASPEASKPPTASKTMPPATNDLMVLRKFWDAYNGRLADRMKQVYPVSIRRDTIGGIPVEIVTPAGGVKPQNRGRVLVNLHGGAFMWGAGAGGEVEAIPIAAVGGFEVITVDYRMAPEAHFPAASEDVVAVYGALLKRYQAKSIGIYGCSAGGILTAQSVAFIIQKRLPVPGAIGTFCGSAAEIGGDTAKLAPITTGETFADDFQVNLPYFKGASRNDPTLFAVKSPELLRQFPPTLLLAGSRDFTLSSLFQTQRELTRVGVVAELHVWDGLAHAFFMDPDIPESKETYKVVSDFFSRHLRP
jgi:monoterpene epsilon-lactone hydrolase